MTEKTLIKAILIAGTGFAALGFLMLPVWELSLFAIASFVITLSAIIED